MCVRGKVGRTRRSDLFYSVPRRGYRGRDLSSPDVSVGFARSPAAASLRGRVRGGRRRREVEWPHAVVEDAGENADEGPVDHVVGPVLSQDPANL